ncbi:hypothetical protein [Corynebacterium yonathiae]|uniref:Uncharacterized protein n=1 Tax=Corynebacterium yonathiae TaxID=2913504 RepID=A0A9X3LY90_9CORY|nr:MULTISPECIES: hypothetical protein [Corynebacterium]MCZ9296177.1 hypothetical protein [Corynebacterium yonathiae]MDK2583061.1 hypothetical protein [Corynebacterium sp. BWA136]
MEDILVEGILASLETARDLALEVFENVTSVFDAAAVSSEGSSQKLEGSSEAAKGIYNIVDAIG